MTGWRVTGQSLGGQGGFRGESVGGQAACESVGGAEFPPIREIREIFEDFFQSGKSGKTGFSAKIREKI